MTLLDAARFAVLWRRLGARRDADPAPAFAMLRAAYGEAHRAYHTDAHIAACLMLFDEPAVRALAAHPDEVEAALWFHDVVYDTAARDNEERSAVLCHRLLTEAGVAAAVAGRVAALVRATRDHVAADDDARVLLDVDLSILGMPAAVYDVFERDIRREYAWVPDDAWRKGRGAVLQGFLARPRIFTTDVLHARLDAMARSNLARALAALA